MILVPGKNNPEFLDITRFYAFLRVVTRLCVKSLSIDINFQIEIRCKLYIKILS